MSALPDCLRLALIDSRPLVRAAICYLLEGKPERQSAHGFLVQSFASSGDFIDHSRSPAQDVDVILLNIGAALTCDTMVTGEVRRLREHLPGVPIALLCDRVDACDGLDAIRMGVDGYIPTTLSPAVATHAIRLVHAGCPFVPVSVWLDSIEGKSTFEPKHPAVQSGAFTGRERDVLNLLWQGKSNKVIAYHLSLSDSTVKVYVRQIMKKLGANNRTHAIFLLSQSMGRDEIQ